MKLAEINPGKLFRLKKSRSVRRSEPLSFNSKMTSSSAFEESGFKKQVGLSIPTSVLASTSAAVSTEEWTEVSAAVYFELCGSLFRAETSVRDNLDRDSDGRITKEELESFLSRLGAEPPNKEELQLMLNEVGCISLEEFHTRGGR